MLKWKWAPSPVMIGGLLGLIYKTIFAQIEAFEMTATFLGFVVGMLSWMSLILMVAAELAPEESTDGVGVGLLSPLHFGSQSAGVLFRELSKSVGHFSLSLVWDAQQARSTPAAARWLEATDRQTSAACVQDHRPNLDCGAQLRLAWPQSTLE
jgi:hypothetical protein